ncbi:ExeM/NucH family extracellular endonuclease [Fulvimarina manganoxydans]|uniref:ExeM/NucH family extracellular endonuclease n=1 Tax=Fulvimarina manganoxydans TaxID=937218 RepID=UPI00148288C3|nr:ExeM/NucH family extracellular endonuclease [Fulvimarina manganoxydans]
MTNTSGVAINSFTLSYDLLVLNDQDRSNSWNVAVSTSNKSFTPVAGLGYSSAAASDDLGVQAIEKTQTITLDSSVEAGSTFYVQFSSNDVSGSGSRDELGIDNIVINAGDAPSGATVSISDASIVEGDEGTKTLIFTVTRGDGTGAASVDYATSDGTAEAGSDYQSAAGTIEFAENETSKTISVTINGDTDIEANETFTVTLSNPSDGLTIADAEATGTIETDDIAITKISAIQGSGTESTMKGDTVTVEAVVTADFQSNSDSDYNGFFLQEEASDSDNDASTSEGLFVYEGGNSVDVKVGDKVKVTGTVTEYNGETQLTLSSVEVVDGSNDHLGDVTPAAIAFPTTNVIQNDAGQLVADLEAYEGMLVTVPEVMTVGDLYTLGRYNEVGLTSGGRIATFTQTNDPSVEGFAQFQQDAAARALVIDDAFYKSSGQNKNPIYPQGGLNADEGPILRAGDTVSDLQGVLTYRPANTQTDRDGKPLEFANFRLIPTEEPQFVSNNPRPEEAPDVGGTLKVASFNVLNFFTTLNVDGAETGPAGNMDPRGAENDNEYVRQLDKLASAMIKLGADIFGLTELENGQQGDSALDALIAKLNGLGETVYDYVKTGPIQGAMGDPVEGDAIKVGFIYNTGTVDAIGDYALLDETVDDRFQSVGTQRPTLAQTFEQKSGGEKITVAINHLKSKGSVVDGDEATGDGQANNNHVRTEAAEALVDWLKNDPTGEGNGDNLIIGDLNSYLKEDPIKAIQAGADDKPGTDDDYTSLLSSDDYSFGFPISLDGVPQVQTYGSLDHALASASLATKVTGAASWHINADEASVLDYNTNYKSEEQQSDLYKNDPYRSSDHDPLIVGLDLSNSETPLNVSVYNGPSFDGQIVPTKNIELDSLSQTKLSGAEIAAYDAGSKQLLVTSSDGLQYLDISDPKAPSLSRTVDLKTVTDPSTGNNFTTTDITSVAAKNGIIAVALPAANKTDAGQVVFLDKDGAVLGSVTVGSLPDMLTFTPDGMKVLVANEGEPSKGFEVNPKGSVSIIDLSNGADQATVETADFTAFDGQENALRAEGVRIFEGQSVSDDVEPEYIAVTPDGTKALVTLQEANAVAIVDIESAAVTEIVPLGGKSFANLLADFSDRDGAGGEEAINLTTDNPVIGQFMPDAISSYTAGDGKVYFVTANEGDDRDDFLPNEETIRLKNDDYKLDSDTYPNATELKQDADLGRLNVSNAALLDGDTDGDGDVDQILTYGARSFSILDANGKMIFDSGDAIERIVASEFPDLFDDGRSGKKGPEPEGVTVAEIGGRSYAFVGLERSNLSLVFDVTDPTNVTYTTAATTEGDEEPEGTLVISAADSPTGKALYVSPNEGSKTLSIYEATVAEPEPFTLELLHFSDQEGATNAIEDAPNLSAVLNALRGQDLGNDGMADNTLTISSGDLFIPGVFGNASAALYGAAGIADIQIQNELGIQASALGNHDFDYGTKALAGLISGSAGEGTSAGGMILGKDFAGTAFPYLSSNLVFSTDEDLAPLEVAGGQAPQGNVVTSSVVIDVNGEKIGVVGATTPILGSISSTGGVGILPEDFDNTPTPEQLDALAAVIQTEVDALLEANPQMDKVILTSHMQQISIEEALATRLHDVDIIIAGGSDTRLLDDNDRPRDDQSSQGQYPFFTTDAKGHPIAVVNTDGQYQYVGRLVIDFDENGHLVTDSYDEEISGAYATDDQGVAALGAENMVDPEIQTIIDQMEEQIIATESNVFGLSDVFLNGNRSGTGSATDPDGVRTQETNLGDLTADANLAYANEMAQKLGEEAPVLVSIKNGGGIRASIGETVVPAGGTEAVRTANEPLVDGEGNIIKPEGGISQTDIQGALAFNNSLSLVTLTRAELVAVLEHGVAGLPGVAGQFAQVAGIEMSFDPTREAGDRIVNAAIVDENGDAIANLVVDGEIAGDPGQSFRVVTLGFLAGGGDNYPFPTGDAVNRVDLIDLDGDGNADDMTTGDATFAFDGTEQDAFAEYLHDNYLETPYSVADQGPLGDIRIQNLALRDDVVSLIGTGDGGNSGGGDGVTGGGSDPVIDTGTDGGDVFENPTFPGSIDGGAGIDRVSLPNAYSDYVLTPTEGGFALALASDPSEVIDLSNVEVLQFGDLTLERNDSPEAATIYGLYGSIFGRTPDLTGISFWVDANESGVSLETVAEFFTQSAEFIDTYGANPTDDALVDGFFGNILGRTGDAEGEAFWKAALDNGLSTADLLLGFAQSSEFVGLIDNQIDDGIFVIQ